MIPNQFGNICNKTAHSQNVKNMFAYSFFSVMRCSFGCTEMGLHPRQHTFSNSLFPKNLILFLPYTMLISILENSIMSGDLFLLCLEEESRLHWLGTETLQYELCFWCRRLTLINSLLLELLNCFVINC